MLSMLSELWAFMRVRKKFWLLPIVVVMLLFGALMIWPAAFERLMAPVASAGDTARRVVAADSNLGALVLGVGTMLASLAWPRASDPPW